MTNDNSTAAATPLTTTSSNLPGEGEVQQAAPAEFKFDVKAVEVEADASSDPTVIRIISAKLRKPTKDELIKREAMSRTEIVEASATEDELEYEDSRANSYLFDKLVTEVKGFRLKGEAPSASGEWRTADEKLLAVMPESYKAAFVKKMYSDVTAKLYDDGEEGVVLGGGEILPVDLIFGDEDNPAAVIRFDVPEPTESERRKYSNDAVKLRQPRGGRKSRNRIVSNLDASVRFFDELMRRPEADITSGSPDFKVTVVGRTFAESKSNPIALGQFLDNIDPIYKRSVVTAAMAKYNVKVSD